MSSVFETVALEVLYNYFSLDFFPERLPDHHTLQLQFPILRRNQPFGCYLEMLL